MTASHAMAVGGSRTASRGTVFVLVVLTALLVIMQTAYRTIEIRLADVFIGLFDQHTRVDPSGPTIYFGLGTPKALGLTMTPECTSAFLILPLLVVGAIMIALRPRITRRVVFALAISSVVLILVNQFRLCALVVLVHLLGTDHGYYWGHTLGGSMVSVFGGAVALVLFVWIATRKSKTERNAAKQARTAAARDEG